MFDASGKTDQPAKSSKAKRDVTLRCILDYTAPSGIVYEKGALYDVDQELYEFLMAGAPGYFVVEKKTGADLAIEGMRQKLGKPLEGPPSDQTAPPAVVRGEPTDTAAADDDAGAAPPKRGSKSR